MLKGAYRRVVSYKFGELNMLVRFEVDCVEKTTKTTWNTESLKGATSSLDDMMSHMMSHLNLWGVKKFEDSSSPSSSLHYIEYGKFNPNERLVELTTKGRRIFPDNKWNQLFFSQTDLLVIGWHTRGKLEEIEKLSFSDVRMSNFN